MCSHVRHIALSDFPCYHMQNRLGEMSMGQEREIRQVVLSLGADACGFAAVDRFEDAPEGFHPRDIYPDCRGVVVFLKRMPKGLAQVSPAHRVPSLQQHDPRAGG
jgi:hypothetical protein